MITDVRYMHQYTITYHKRHRRTMATTPKSCPNTTTKIRFGRALKSHNPMGLTGVNRDTDLSQGTICVSVSAQSVLHTGWRYIQIKY